MDAKGEPIVSFAPTPQFLWLPAELRGRAEKKELFFLDASHRGEMYHYRAAMALNENADLCLFNCKNGAQDLIAYLKRLKAGDGRYIFLAQCPQSALKNQYRKPTAAALNGSQIWHNGASATVGPAQLGTVLAKPTIGERECTEIISRASGDSTKLATIRAAMARITPDTEKKLNVKFPNMFKEVWGNKQPTVLALYRKTGTKWSEKTQTGGVYPELDTGNALLEINGILPKIGDKAIRMVTCGNPTKIGDLANIGEFWDLITDSDVGPDSHRDAEAYYMAWLAKNGHFQVAVSFRSGALDLYTFLGIPTVSIGLRSLRGEIRHQLLAKKVFKRYNVQYDRPRHFVTSYYKREPNEKYDQMCSPFWGQAPPSDALDRCKHMKPTEAGEVTPQEDRASEEYLVTDDDDDDDDNGFSPEPLELCPELPPARRKTLQTEDPIAFSPFDLKTVEMCLNFALADFMKATNAFTFIMAPPGGYLTRTFWSRTARYILPTTAKTPDEKKASIKKHKAEDEAVLHEMRDNKLRYQELDRVYTDYYEKWFKEDWLEIEKKIKSLEEGGFWWRWVGSYIWSS